MKAVRNCFYNYSPLLKIAGPGSYFRMKAAMNAHVDQERRVMFQESADEVQNRLEALVRSVEETMSQRTDEVFLAMRGDYRSVLGGSENVDGEVLPKAQRIMRKEVMSIIEGVEKMFKKVIGSADEDEELTLNVKDEDVSDEEGGFPDDDQILQPDDAGFQQKSASVHDVSEAGGLPGNEQIPQPDQASDLDQSKVFGLTDSSEARPKLETTDVDTEETKAELIDLPIQSSDSADSVQEYPSHLYGNPARGYPSHLYGNDRIRDEDDSMRLSESEEDIVSSDGPSSDSSEPDDF